MAVEADRGDGGLLADIDMDMESERAGVISKNGTRMKRRADILCVYLCILLIGCDKSSGLSNRRHRLDSINEESPIGLDVSFESYDS